MCIVSVFLIIYISLPKKSKPFLGESHFVEEPDDLSVPLDNDDWLVRFLRRCKFYPESAKELIKRYYSFKVKHSNIYDGLIPSRQPRVFKQNLFTALANRDQLGRRIILLELGHKWKYKEVTLEEIFKCCIILIESAVLEPETQVHGGVAIIDMDGLTLQHTCQFTPQCVKLMVNWLQDCIPLRVKALHVVAQPKIFDIIFSICKLFLREKLRSRIFFHGTNYESLYQHISPKCLPVAYGGIIEMTRIEDDEWDEYLLQCDPEHIAINSYGYKKKKK